jgi:hypothetical protein
MPTPPSNFSLRHLTVIAYANDFTLWHYRAKGILDVLDTRFFLDARDLITPGDQIHISAPDGALLGVFEGNKHLVVMSKVLFDRGREEVLEDDLGDVF